MTPWVVLLPLIVVLVMAFLVGAWMQWRRGSHEILLRGDPVRARQTVDYYVHVQDSLNG
jgi:uncharacterized integral membrane protein